MIPLFSYLRYTGQNVVSKVKTLFLFYYSGFLLSCSTQRRNKKSTGRTLNEWKKKEKRKTFEKCGLRLQLSQRIKKGGKQIDIVTIKTDGRGLGVEFYYSGSLKFKTRLIFG